LHLEISRSFDRPGYHEQERALERDDEDDAILEREPIGGGCVPVLGHYNHDDLASLLVRDDCGDHDDMALMQVHGDHDDLAQVHDQHHRGHDHENPMAAQVPGHDEGSEWLHGDVGQEHRHVRGSRSVL